MTILYFAWLRQRVGIGEEQIPLPPTVKTVSDLADHLKSRSDLFAGAFSDRTRLRAAVNQEHAAWDAPVGPDDEVAFFPPVTGG